MWDFETVFLKVEDLVVWWVDYTVVLKAALMADS
jgi:hypothetical protein